MRCIVSFLFLLFFSLPAQALQPPTNITIIGDRNYAPYSYEKDGIATGLYVDILQAVFSHLEDHQVTLKMEPWKRGLSMIKEGTKLAIFPPYYWSEKRPYISEYSEPIYKEQVVSICNKQRLRSTDMKWPIDYQGFKVGTNRGFLAPGPEFFKLVDQDKITLVETQNSDTALRLLSLKRIDCYVNSKLTIQWSINNLERNVLHRNLSENLAYTSIISENNAYIGYSKAYLEKNSSDRGFISEVDQIIRDMKDKGELQNILIRFLSKN